MNPHINLIKDSERRSASPVHVRFILRLAGALLPSLALIWLSLGFMQSRQLHTKLIWAEEEWSAIEPRFKAAMELQRDLVRVRDIESEINGWRNARHSWVPVLQALRETVPETIQMTMLQSEERLQLDGSTPVRTFNLKIWGRARGAFPDADVQSLRNAVSEHPILGNLIHQASIPRGSFGVDPATDADRAHRVFQLHAEFIPLRFE